MNEIKKRETSTNFEFEGREFIIKSYDPILGNWILMQLLTMVLPMGIGASINKEMGSEMIPTDSSKVAKMSKEEFMDLQRDILKTVEERYPGGNTSPVVRENNTYGIMDVSMSLIIKLLIASVTFNFKDFFSAVPSLDLGALL